MDKFIINLDKHANTSSASIPIALHEAVTEGKSKAEIWWDLSVSARD